MKKFLHPKKSLFALLLALFVGMGTANAYDFYKTCSTGQRLYYNIIDASNHYVEITCPGTPGATGWNGYTKPTGNITLPSTVTNSSVTYTVTKIGNYAFYYCNGLTGTLIIPNSVSLIGHYSFYNCNGFTGLTLGNSVDAIQMSAFANCTGLGGSLTIPNSVTEINAEAFLGCSGFTGTLTLGNSLHYILGSAFEGCSGFTGTLTIPSSVAYLAGAAFKNCTGFTQVKYNAINCSDDLDQYDKPFEGCHGTLTIGNSVQTIPAYMFYQCTGFTGSLTIPNSVTFIGASAFRDCNGFTGSLVLGNSVNMIDNHAFRGISGFTSMKVCPATPPILGSYIFYNVSPTIPVYVPCESLSVYQNTPGWNAFTNMQVFGCDPLTYSINSDGVSVTVTGHVDGTAATGELIIPETKTINGVTYDVTAIGEYAFYNCSGLTGTLTIPNSVNTIDVGAFSECSGFTGLIIPNSVTTIGALAFVECSGFNGSLTIPSSVTSIGWGAFDGCSGFTGSLTIPNSITSINDMAFSECSGFTGSLTIPNSVTSIGNEAFFNCTGFTGSLTISNSVTSIGNGAFHDCGGFTGSLTIPNSVTTIGDYAFFGCSGFTGSLNLGNSLTTIGEGAFLDCDSFTGSLTIPNSVTTIGDRAFESCENFTSLTLGNSVTTIGDWAFWHCRQLTSLTIGSGVTTIGEKAFWCCAGLTSIMVYPETPPTLGDDAFAGVPTDVSVYVPCSSLADYQSASGWSAFTNMQCREALTVYDGADINRHIPAYIFYYDEFTRSQFVIPAADLADMIGASISSMTFYTQAEYVPYSTTCSADVYLKEVNFTNISAYVSKASSTTVYSGTFSIESTDSGGEMTIHFSTPYTYSGGNLLVGIENTALGGFESIYFYGQTISGASISGSSSSTGTIPAQQQNFIPKTTFGYTPHQCSRPIDLTATDITPNSALLQWTGYQDDYDLRYRKKPLFFEDFEDGLPSDWTTIDNDGDGYDWHSTSNYGSYYCHSGRTIMVSASYDNDNDIALTPDNWLITPRLELQGTMKVWVRALHPNYAREHFAIYLSTTGMDTSDFTTVLVPETTLTGTQYTAYTANLSAYAGQQGYIAIRHFNCSDMYEILLDDFGLFGTPDETGEWETLNNVGSSYTLSDLEPATAYEWQVRGHNCSGNGTNTDWSSVHSFTTLLCSPEDQCELTFTLTDRYGDSWNGAAIKVVDVETGIVLATMANQDLDGAYGAETQTVTLAVCDGRELRFEWVSGSFNNECAYVVTDANGNEVFSGSGAMSAPVTYMVNCGGGQTITLASGVNWVSFDVETTLDDLKAVLVATGGTNIVIKAKNSSTTWNGYRWLGALNGFNVNQMFMIILQSGCEITLQGMPMAPGAHPVTISNGTNWIGFPLNESMTLTEAFAGFPANQDVVKSKTASATWNGHRWVGQLTNLVPGQGYIYQSKASGNKTFTFPTGEK